MKRPLRWMLFFLNIDIKRRIGRLVEIGFLSKGERIREPSLQRHRLDTRDV